MEYDGIPYRVISPEAKIGNNVTIMPFVTICAGAVIGDNCYIGQGCFIGMGTTVGDNCFFAGNCFICTPPIEYENEPSCTERTVRIGNNVMFLNGCSVEAGKTVISNNVSISQNCTVQRSVFIGEESMLLPNCYVALGAHLEGQNRLAANTVVGKYVVLEKGVCSGLNCVFWNKMIYKKQTERKFTLGDFDGGNTYSSIFALPMDGFAKLRKKMRYLTKGDK